MNTRTFRTAEVVSAITGRLLCDIQGVYEVLNFLHGCFLFTHQLPRAGREAAPFVYEEHPQLKDVDVSCVTPDNWREFVVDLEQKYGVHLNLMAIPFNEELRRDPVDEAVEMAGPNRGVVIE